MVRFGERRRQWGRLSEGVDEKPIGQQAFDVREGSRYRQDRWMAMILGLVALVPTTSAQAGPLILNRQSDARPYGLQPVGPAYERGTDSASEAFLTTTLQSMSDFAGGGFSDGSWTALNPSSMTLSSPADLRTYFVGSDTSFQNSLGFYTTPGGINASDAALIFPNATTHSSHGASQGQAGARPPHAPLLPGDFVQLGSFDVGTQLDFFLIADGARSNGSVWYTDPSLNGGVERAVAFAQAGNPYVLVGFEDGADGQAADYRDVLFAVYLGESNTSGFLGGGLPGQGVPVPEPGLIWLMVAGCGGWLHRARRKRREQTGTA